MLEWLNIGGALRKLFPEFRKMPDVFTDQMVQLWLSSSCFVERIQSNGSNVEAAF
jgi:hypothetical protein